MKKHLISHICTSLVAICLLHTSYAQDHAVLAKNNQKQNVETYNQSFSSDVTTSTKKLNKSDVSSRTIRSFSKLFKNSEPSWSVLDKNFLATFEVEGRYARALFTNSGYNIYTILRGTEKNLPSDVRSIIKSNYIDFTIGTVNEVRVADKTAWFVNLQSDKELVVAKVIDSELEEVSRHSLGK